MFTHRFNLSTPSAVVLLFIIGACSLYAQSERMPFDDAGRSTVRSVEREQQLRLIPEAATVHDATIHELQDSVPAPASLVAEAGEQPAQPEQHPALTASEGDAPHGRVADSAEGRLSPDGPDQSGRSDLLVSSTALSLAYYGWSIPMALDMRDRAAVGAYMFTGAAGFFLPYLLTSNARVTHGDAALSLGLGVLGIAHGALVSVLLGGTDVTPQTVLLSSTVASLGEFAAGYCIADNTNMTAGKADVITYGGLFGLGMGVELLALTANEHTDVRGAAAIPLLISGLGMYGGNAIANAESYTAGDASIAAEAGLLGAYAPLAAVYLGDHRSDPRAYVGASLLGTCAGLTLGHFLVKGKDFSNGDAALFTLGTGSGILLGAGMAYLLTSESQNDPLGNYLVATSLGGVGGFALMYTLLSKNAEVHDTRTGSKWKVHLSPEGLTGYLLRDKLSLPATTSYQMVGVSAKF